MGQRELVALLNLSSLCVVILVWLFLVVPWVCLQFVIVVFPDNTHSFNVMSEKIHYFSFVIFPLPGLLYRIISPLGNHKLLVINSKPV